jgi:hypothetical protein
VTKITYVKNNYYVDRYALTEEYAQIRRNKLTEEGITWNEEKGFWNDVYPEELGAWIEPN